jgi:ribosome-associated toxin RatA of RatAB toxin-antitoxin module
MVKKIGIGIAVVIVLVLIIGFISPSTAHVERSIIIQASPEKIFPIISDLESFQKISPWYEMEPDVKMTYGEKKSGVGAVYSWSGKKTGEGSMTISVSEENKKVVTDLDFKGQGKAKAYWTLTPTEDGTKTVWGFDSEPTINPISRIFNNFMNSMIGKDFERGLSKLKSESEK